MNGETPYTSMDIGSFIAQGKHDKKNWTSAAYLAERPA
jgi:hypothetical protein